MTYYSHMSPQHSPLSTPTFSLIPISPYNNSNYDIQYSQKEFLYSFQNKNQFSFNSKTEEEDDSNDGCISDVDDKSKL